MDCVWVAVQEDLAVCWEWVNGARGEIAGMHFYGKVSALRLRGVRMLDLQLLHIEHHPKWHVTATDPDDIPGPPSGLEIRQAWNSSRRHRTQHLPDPGPRREAESSDQFYRRVARNYRALATLTGKPTKSLAETSGVSKSLAGVWVHRARARGYLPPTSKGTVNL